MAVKIYNVGLNNIKISNPTFIPQEISIYSGSVDDTVRKIDSEGNEIWSFTGHTHYVYAVAVTNGTSAFW